MSISTSPMSSSSSSPQPEPYWQFVVRIGRDNLCLRTTEPSLTPLSTVSTTETLGQEYSGDIEGAAVLEITLLPLPASGYDILLHQACIQLFTAPPNDGWESIQQYGTSARYTTSGYSMEAAPIPTETTMGASTIEFRHQLSVSCGPRTFAGYLNDGIEPVLENPSYFVDGGFCQLEYSISEGVSTYDKLSEETELSSNSSTPTNLVYRGQINHKSSSITNASSITSPTKPSPTTVPESSPSPRHHCPWASCKSSFGRAADRNRHFVTKHGRPVKYFCPMPGCRRGRGLWKGYSREDKVKEHVKKVHVHAKF
jgi:hypothetical protein